MLIQIVTITSSGHVSRTKPNARDSSWVLVRSATHNAPWTRSVTHAASPIEIVYQSKTPIASNTRKLVQSGRKKPCEESNGTPRRTLPNATPKKNASIELAELKTTSQRGIQARL